MGYIKVTDELPPSGVEVWSFNGEHEIKNVYEGGCWKYEFKYPTTHWTHKPQLPNMDEVTQVRSEL